MLVTALGIVNVPDRLLHPLNAFVAIDVTVYSMASSPSPTVNVQGISEVLIEVEVAIHAADPLPSAAVLVVAFVLTVHVTPLTFTVPTAAFAAIGDDWRSPMAFQNTKRNGRDARCPSVCVVNGRDARCPSCAECGKNALQARPQQVPPLTAANAPARAVLARLRAVC